MTFVAYSDTAPFTQVVVQFWDEPHRLFQFDALLDTGAPLTLFPARALQEDGDVLTVELRGCRELHAPQGGTFRVTLAARDTWPEEIAGMEGPAREYALFQAEVDVTGFQIRDLSLVSFHYDQRKKFAVIGLDILLPRPRTDHGRGVCFAGTSYRGRLCRWWPDRR